MESAIIEIKNVHAYLDKEGTVWLNAADVARGLGFIEFKDGKEYVRWRTINGYLKDFGFSHQVGKDDFLPENIFYRLAMKAKNEVAEKFQAKVADEILPAIRKHGLYATDVWIIVNKVDKKKFSFKIIRRKKIDEDVLDCKIDV